MEKHISTCFLILVVCLSWSSESFSKNHNFKVALVTSGETSQAFSYVTRELRSLGDVLIVDKDYDYSIHITTMSIKNTNGNPLGYAMAEVILNRYDGFLVSNLTFFGETGLESRCESLVADFDTHLLEPHRQHLQSQEVQVAGVPPKPSYSWPSSTSNVIERNGVYVAYANGIVKDTKTGLEWKVGPDKDTDWYEAKSWVQSLTLDGGGWRMPTMDELEGLYRKGAGNRNMTPLLKTSGYFVWSGKTEDSHGGVWLFEFYSGNRDWLYPNSGRFFSHRDRRSYSGRAFAVRSRGDG